MNNTKAKILGKIDTEYLQSLAISICNVPRYFYLYEDKNKIIKTLSNKLTKEQIMKIYRFYLLDYGTIEVSKFVKEPNGKDMLFHFIENSNLFKKSDFFLSEVLIKGKRCDLVHIDENYKVLDAIEIKANGDKLDNAFNQCKFYSKWADRIWLLIGNKHFKKINELKKFRDHGIGLIVYNSSKNIKLIWKPKINILSPEALNFLPVIYLKNIARRNNLTTSLAKKELIDSIIKVMNSKTIITEYRKEISTFLSR
ncbi:MAG: hypothetical protein ACFE95_18260 [Candidatus Hodarchaeota archaeon]